ncbi:hypothetical protein H5P28_12655 [Ruficoccus amylovorans]|uniref:Uncharacterized protein n=1 Tax=Ruficoccus amylovorans TaxID=1804625 RepID=A0A842HFY2_9BACT|nr:hypothetical protein [Ruficoccus amylovorans]MBC2595110.1 hypothetical protein [Ruficoccus amylovorans]
MLKFFLKHGLSCRDATRLISESRERHLSFWEKLKLRLLCRCCCYTDRYRQQIEAVCSQVENHPECCEEALSELGLCEESRARMKARLREE